MKNILTTFLLLISFSAFAQRPDTASTQTGGVQYNSHWNGSYAVNAGTAYNGTTAQRPNPAPNGFIRYNTDSISNETWNGYRWLNMPDIPMATRINRTYVTWNAITDQAQVYNDDHGIKRISGSGDIENFSVETLGKGQAVAWKITSRDDNNMRVGINPAQSGGIATIDYVAILNFYISAEVNGASDSYSSNPTAATNGHYWRIAFNDDNSVTLDQSSDGSTWNQMHTYSLTEPGDSDTFYVMFYGAAINFGTDEIFIMNIL